MSVLGQTKSEAAPLPVYWSGPPTRADVLHLAPASEDGLHSCRRTIAITFPRPTAWAIAHLSMATASTARASVPSFLGAHRGFPC
jgi:hypothetical protein